MKDETTRTHSGARSWSQAPPFLLLAAVLVAVVAFASMPTAAQSSGLAGLNGGSLGEADLQSGTTVIVVWTTWSPRCRDIVERVNQIHSSWGGKASVVTVNFQEERDKIESFLEGNRLEAPVYLDTDGSFSKRHGVTRLPVLIVYKGGEVAYNGAMPTNPERVLSEILG